KTVSAATATTTPKIFDVDVGNEEGALIFEPDIVMASLKDVINFHFYPINHSVAQSSFEKPCEPLTGGVGQLPIFSGFLPVKSGKTVVHGIVPQLNPCNAEFQLLAVNLDCFG